MPKVSVIIPTHNRADALQRAIMSVLAQSFQDFEIIVVDDVSSDHTEEVVCSFADTRLHYIRHTTNKGDAGTRNTGIQQARGEYIAFLDDDDEWLSDKLRQQVTLLDSSPADVAGVSTARMNIDNKTGHRLGVWPIHRADNLLQDNFITTSAIMLRRTCFETVGLFDENMLTSSDYDMWLRIARVAHFLHIETPLIKYYIHPHGLSHNVNKVIQGIELLLAKHQHDFARYKDGYSQEYFALGVCYCETRQMAKGRAALCKAIRLRPTHIRAYFHLGLSLFGAAGYRLGIDTVQNRKDAEGVASASFETNR